MKFIKLFEDFDDNAYDWVLDLYNDKCIDI